MLFRVIDTESTGIPTEADKHALVEVARCDLWMDEAGDISILPPVSMLVNPGRPIPPEASAVHHIVDADVAGAASPTEACAWLMDDDVDVFVAQNAEFDRQFFGGGDKPWICTWKAALRVWPTAPAHNNQVLRYWLGLNAEMDQALTLPAHRAGPDAYVTAHLLKRLLECETSYEDMIRWSSGPALLPLITFGKHKGKRWEEAPADYLDWIVNKSDLDRDVKANAKFYLKQREQSDG